MKRILALTVALVMCVSLLATSAFAAETEPEMAEVYVTVSTAGEVAIAAVTVDVTDVDGDGAITVNDALVCAHDAEYEGGAKAGYTSYEGDYGLAISKLWGIDNGGSYGYCVNDVPSMSLADPVETGDYVYAYTYSDLKAWSDQYAFFASQFALAPLGVETEFTLYVNGYDDEWNSVVTPLAGATLTIDGEKTEYTTDENGCVAITLDELGTHFIGAVKADAVLVPPVCVTSVIEPELLPITRGAFIAALYELAGSPETESAEFPDVDADGEAAAAISWAAKNAIAVGYGDGSFGADDELTVLQLCAILRNVALASGEDVEVSADISEFGEVADWASPSVEWAKANGILEGKSDLSSWITVRDALALLPSEK